MFEIYFDSIIVFIDQPKTKINLTLVLHFQFLYDDKNVYICKLFTSE